MSIKGQKGQKGQKDQKDLEDFGFGFGVALDS